MARRRTAGLKRNAPPPKPLLEPIPAPQAGLTSLAVAPDGTVWLSALRAGKLLRFRDGAFAEFWKRFSSAAKASESVWTTAKKWNVPAGTYLAPGGPMMQSQGKKPGWRLSGAIIEAPEGLVFFKCVGPSKTIEAAEKDIDALIQSVTKAAKT